ncbi:MAG: lipoyl protein ligase domain-containing protein [Egibacteraceae bacterium]
MRDDWRVLPLEVGEARVLLERGLALLEGLASDPTPTLRWYQASAPVLVLGRGQAGTFGDNDGLAVLTRFSGGGAVLLDADILSLDVLLPAGHPSLEGDLGTVFMRVGGAWARALRSLDIPDVTVWDGPWTARRRGTDREQLVAAICYATLGRGEVLAGGRKLVGLAQRRRRQGALIQCGLLRRWQPAPLLCALGADPDDTEVHHHAVGLADLLADPPPDPILMHAVEREMRTAGS